MKIFKTGVVRDVEGERGTRNKRVVEKLNMTKEHYTHVYKCHNETHLLYTNKGTFTPMFIAALSLVTQKKNEISSFAGKWMELENITLREVSQAQKAKSHMFPLIFRL
jgi:hypothetical protein